ncbi:FecR family protein [Dyadobacter aurulentus]|uniref:FecR family protein n=1 Tax=Dyadobacter sp. UC 10 TaxID=2605428 RepID=UPI0011F10EB8|nr:FecR family protein [Dyadobacter sp. UC 10]KAA0992150.1 FecR family protein [Dyadobacter sp. UC 10]
MKNYAAYLMEDFAGDDDFRDWVHGDRQKEDFWKAFLEQYPGKAEVMRRAEQIIRAADVPEEELSGFEIRREVDRFLETANRDQQSDNKGINFKTLLAVAAVLAVALLAGWQLFFRDTNVISKAGQTLEKPRLVQTANDTDKPISVVLEDGSTVVLSPKSSIGYPSEFKGAERKVYLKGEAVFSVRHSSRPFMVCTGDMVTKVLGTRFVVRAFEKDKKISVQVQSGKVSVYSTKQAASANVRERSGVILTANQAAIFEKEQNLVSKTLVANPVLIAKDIKVINQDYDEVSLPVILKELEKGYGIAIQFDQETFQKCRITANLSNETLFEKLDLLCKTVSATYEIVDGQITISGPGCQ